MLKRIPYYLMQLIRGERKWIDVWYFFQGHYREKLYYSRWKFLMRKHIKEQFEMRLELMDRECYNNGQCKICGCDIPALTLSNKSCEGECYPAFHNRKDWKQIREHWVDIKNEINKNK